MKQRRTVEDYLKTISLLSVHGEVHNSDIADALGVSRPTVSISLKQMTEEGFVYMLEDKSVHLTEKGEQVAREVLERNRTFQKLLLSLGVDEEIALKDACEMEHAISRVSFEALKRFLQQQDAGAVAGAVAREEAAEE